MALQNSLLLSALPALFFLPHTISNQSIQIDSGSLHLFSSWGFTCFEKIAGNWLVRSGSIGFYRVFFYRVFSDSLGTFFFSIEPWSVWFSKGVGGIYWVSLLDRVRVMAPARRHPTPAAARGWKNIGKKRTAARKRNTIKKSKTPPKKRMENLPRGGWGAHPWAPVHSVRFFFCLKRYRESW